MKFKTDRIQQEYKDLPKQNLYLVEVLTLLESFCRNHSLAEPVITCIYRTPEENAAANGIPNSPHCIWEGADIRSSIYNRDEITNIVYYLNGLMAYRPKGATKPLALYHSVRGSVPHIHIQVRKVI